MRALSLRGSVERVRFGDASKTAGSVGIEERALAYLNKGWFSARYLDVFAIGGGNAGVDGGLGMDGALGLRAPFAERHGPFFRLGVRAHLLHRGRFHTSLVEFPQAQLGYSLLARAIHVDLGARAGYSLVGRYAIDGAPSRRLGSTPEFGGYGAIGLRPIRLDVEVSRIASGNVNLTPVDTLSALLCGVASPPTVCVRAELLRGDVRGPSGQPLPSSSAYLGISVGVGPAEWR
jgi:hypothetical protein